MFEAALNALADLASPMAILYLFIGIAMGLVVGLLPGLNGVTGLAILLPFVFGQEPANGIAMLIGASAVCTTSDMFPAVLLGVPGSSSSQATIMDGYPLAQRGQAARALGAGLSASCLGGVLGAVVLAVVVVVAAPIIYAFGSPELFMLALLGLSTVGLLSTGRTSTSLLVAAIGLLIGSIGAAPGSPAYRFTFDQLYLYNGLDLTIVALGLFAIPEILDLVRSGKAISKVRTDGAGIRSGIGDTRRNLGLVGRSSVLGAFIGFLPGLSGSVVDWVTYAVAKRTLKGADKSFGTGDIRGIIAPESAASAREGGALIPTLLFGIPGSNQMAVLLGAFLTLGIQVGPDMLGKDLEVTYTIIWTIAIANVIATICCLVFAQQIAKISAISGRALFGFLLILCCLAAYQASFKMADIVVFLGLGVLGWLMKHAGWARPPLLIGFVLAEPVERYLHISVSRFGFSWLSHWLVIVIGVCIIAVVFAGPIGNAVRKVNPRAPKKDDARDTVAK